MPCVSLPTARLRAFRTNAPQNPEIPSQEPGLGFEDLLPCPNRVVTLDGNYLPDVPGQIINAKVSAALGLPPWPLAADEHTQAGGGGKHQRKRRVRELRSRGLEEGEKERQSVGLTLSSKEDAAEKGEDRGRLVGTARGGGTGSEGPFDLSVLCTVVSDVNHLMKPTYAVDPRLVDALLWNVGVRFRHACMVPQHKLWCCVLPLLRHAV